MNIVNDIQSKSLNRYPELEKIWNESHDTPHYQAPHSVSGWVSEFYQSKPHEKLASWADSFQQDHGVNVWATEFEQISILSTHHFLNTEIHILLRILDGSILLIILLQQL